MCILIDMYTYQHIINIDFTNLNANIYRETGRATEVRCLGGNIKTTKLAQFYSIYNYYNRIQGYWWNCWLFINLNRN